MTTAWFTYIGVATYQWEKHHAAVLPPPAIYVGSSLVFSGLSIVGEAAPGFAGMFAWALVVAAAVSGAFNEIPNTPDPTAAQVAGARQTVATQRRIATVGPPGSKRPPNDVGPPPKGVKGLLTPPTGKKKHHAKKGS